jgi:hypothetical protein
VARQSRGAQEKVESSDGAALRGRPSGDGLLEPRGGGPDSPAIDFRGGRKPALDPGRARRRLGAGAGPARGPARGAACRISAGRRRKGPVNTRA